MFMDGGGGESIWEEGLNMREIRGDEIKDRELERGKPWHEEGYLLLRKNENVDGFSVLEEGR